MDKHILKNMEKLMKRLHPDVKKWSVIEYGTFYAVVADKMQPILFEKESGLPMFKSIASISDSEKKNPKVVYESGGKKNGKK